MRFIGGGLAPYAAGRLADAYDLSVPFYVGAGAFVLAIVVLATGHRLLAAAEGAPAGGEQVVPTLEPVGAARIGSRPVVVAVATTDDARDVVLAAAGLARDAGSPLEVVHIAETAVVEDWAVDAEDPDAARRALVAHLDSLAAAGTAATGLLLHSVSDAAAAGRTLARHAEQVAARTVAIGTSPGGAAAQLAAGSLTDALTRHVPCPVLLLRPGAPARSLTAEDFCTSMTIGTPT